MDFDVPRATAQASKIGKNTNNVELQKGEWLRAARTSNLQAD
jgi:hypothetical protein